MTKENTYFADHTIIKRVDTPWGDRCIEASYDGFDARLDGYRCVIVLDTVRPHADSGWDASNYRITTMIVRFPRCILSEMNTHRVFSRNSASSRARSLKTTIKQVLEDPYIPLFTENAKGMGGSYITDDYQLGMAKAEWLDARDAAVDMATRMLGTGVTCPDDVKERIDIYYDKYYGKSREEWDVVIPNVHKQTVNRLLEPFMWHEMLITSSYWENFFKLRMDEAAQPEIQAIATLMFEAMNASVPELFPEHIPFVKREQHTSLSALLHDLKKSAAECARISYVDRSTAGNKDGAEALATRLLSKGHMSPFEHQAIDPDIYRTLSPGGEFALSTTDMSGNLDPCWVQGRHIFEHQMGEESHV